MSPEQVALDWLRIQQQIAHHRPPPRPVTVREPGRLDTIPPAVYVETLARVEVPDHGRLDCPLHDDHSRDLKVYDTPERGWYCWGCGRGGSIFEFAAALWDLPTRGSGFSEISSRLRALFP